MSKINKYANLYDKDGKLIRRVDEKTGKLENYTLEELEELVDKLADDKDEDGKIRNQQALNNANWVLMQYYHKYGNPHLKEILEKLINSKTTDEQAQEKLREMSEEIEGKNNNSISEGQSKSEGIVDYNSDNDIPEPEMPIVEEIQGGADNSGEHNENSEPVEETKEHDGISEEYAEFEEIEETENEQSEETLEAA